MNTPAPETASETPAAGPAATETAEAVGTVFPVLAVISICHLLNDMMQSLLSAIYPILKANYDLSFSQIGLLTFTFQLTASLLQPVVGSVTDRRPQPYSLSAGMGFTLCGLLALAYAHEYLYLLLGAGLVGIGSSVLHPESSRVARMAAGPRPGLAQALFQVGGNVGSSTGPLIAAFVVLRFGQKSLAWFSLVALGAMLLLGYVGRWYQQHGLARMRRQAADGSGQSGLPPARVVFAFTILALLMFSKFFYTASMSSYYTFFLIERFGLAIGQAQLMLFLFLVSVAMGTVVGGAIGDRLGRKTVIWVSILGVLPFSLALPHVSLLWVGVLSVPIGLILASAFPAIVVYALELMPNRVGTIAGMMFGLAFGLGGIGAALIGRIADVTGIVYVFNLCAFLPVIGLLAGLLPDLRRD